MGEKFESEYRESAEEKEDLKKAYLEAEGDMDQILDTVMCARVEDEARFRVILDKMIKDKEVAKFPAYKKDKKKEEKRKRAAEMEAEEANRGAQAESFLDSLAAKYAKPKKGKKK